MKRMLLIGPNTKDSIFSMRWCTAPLGVHHIASYLNSHGHHAEVWDCNLHDREFSDMVKDKWDIISFSVLTATLEYDLARIHEAKRLSPDSLLVAGGTGASLDYQRLFEKSPLDTVVLGEGEVPMLELCEGKPLHEIDGVVFRKHAKPMTKELWKDIRIGLDVKAMRADRYWQRTAGMYDSPDFSEINTFRIFTMNYCPMNCNFCTLTNLRKYVCGKPTPVIALPVPQVMVMIRKILNEYSECKQIFIVDDDAFLLPDRTVELCESIINLKEENYLPEDLKFICLTNINRLNEINLPLIAQAGFRVLSIGVESTSQDVLNSYNKKQTVEQIFKTTELILKHGIRPYYTIIMFSPLGTVKDLITDLDGFRRLSEMGAGLSLEQYLIPLGGTNFSERGLRQRIREVKIEGTNLTIHKGFAWLPEDPEVMRIFLQFESVYPKYRKWRMDVEKDVKHHEKNWQAETILNCLEFVLRNYFGYTVRKPALSDLDLAKTELALEDYKGMDIDIVGNLVEKEDLH